MRSLTVPQRFIIRGNNIQYSKVWQICVVFTSYYRLYYMEEAAELSVLSRRRWSVVKRSLDSHIYAPAQLICLPIVYTCKFVHDIDIHELSASFLFRLTSNLTNFCVSRWLSYSYPQKGTVPAIVLTCVVKLCLKTLSYKIKYLYHVLLRWVPFLIDLNKIYSPFYFMKKIASSRTLFCHLRALYNGLD